MGGGQAHDHRPQARHRTDLHSIGGVERRCRQRTRPQADHHRVARPRCGRKEQHGQGDEGDGDGQAAGASGHGWSVAEAAVTALARGVPDV